ncbi:MAG: ComEC/Rec2 family competence protein, partial [Pseudomonadota bacterium]
GLYHVLSISGLHMAIMGGAVFFVIRFCLALVPAIALRFDIKKMAAVGALAGAFAYLMISGGAFATVRSFLMISVMFVAILYNRPALALRNVAISALLILLIFPESIVDPGFQMSFAAVIALVSGYSAFEAWQRRRRDSDLSSASLMSPAGLARFGAKFTVGIVVSTVLASLAVAPIALFHFHQAQYYSVIANAVAMPACNLLVMPMALGALLAMPFGLEAWPLALMGVGIEVMTWTSQQVAALPGATGRASGVPFVSIALIAAGGLTVALVNQPARWLGLLLVGIGTAAAGAARTPDVIVAENASLIAVRADDGMLKFIYDRRSGSRYAMRRWLELSGDPRQVEQIRSREGFQCDATGCQITVANRTVVIAQHPRRQADDCTSVDVLIYRYQPQQLCAALRPHTRAAVYPEKTPATNFTTASHTPLNPQLIKWRSALPHTSTTTPPSDTSIRNTSSAITPSINVPTDNGPHSETALLGASSAYVSNSILTRAQDLPTGISPQSVSKIARSPIEITLADLAAQGAHTLTFQAKYESAIRDWL